MANPFQASAESWKAKAHLSGVKNPVLVGIAAVMLVVLYLILQNVWTGLNANSFEVEKQANATAAEAEESKDATSVSEEDGGSIVVHVAGAVVSPGVFELREGERLSAAIEAAGGLRDDAAQEGINLARVLIDGEQIVVPTQESYDAEPFFSEGTEHASAKININTALVAELTLLPGIGEVMAERIVKQRESSGPFSMIDDIKQVSGIGDKKFEQIADLICV